MDAYTYFCYHGEPGDSGKVSISLPAGYEATPFLEKTRTRKAGKGLLITATRKGNPAKVYGCIDAFKPNKLIRSELTSPSGQLVTIEGWPEDPEWSERMTTAVEDVLPQLEELIGRPMPLDEVVIREVSRQSLYGYGSQLGVRKALIRVGEHYDDETAASTGLAGAWFNERTIADTWLDIGLSEWAGMDVTFGGCWPAGEFPGKGKPKLAKWKHLDDKPSEREEAVTDWQENAACEVIEDIATRIGPVRMRAVIASLLDDTPKYGPRPAERRGKRRKADWKDWLDAVDELGLVPSGRSDLKMAEQSLLEVGAATAKQLKGRARARAAYHAALAGMDGTHMPRAVNDLMGAWKFKTAMRAIPLAASTYESIVGNARMAAPDREAFLERFASARSTKALRNLRKQASSFVSVEPPEPDTDAEISRPAGSGSRRPSDPPAV